jgi:hypothetical protein
MRSVGRSIGEPDRNRSVNSGCIPSLLEVIIQQGAPDQADRPRRAGERFTPMWKWRSRFHAGSEAPRGSATMRVLSRDAEDTEARGHSRSSESARSRRSCCPMGGGRRGQRGRGQGGRDREILPMQQTPRAFGTGLSQRWSCGSATKTR